MSGNEAPNQKALPKMRVLILDDHRLFLDGLARVLEQLVDDVEIVEAQTTRQALSIIDEGSKFNLVLADLSLPGLDGFAFLDALRQRRVSIPVVVISGSANVYHVRRALNYGALGFVPKYLGTEQLLEGLRTVMQGEIFLPPDLRQAVLDAPREESAQPSGEAPAIGERQKDVLRLMAEGRSNKEIATILNVAETTVKSHVGALFKAFDVHNRTACVREAARLEIIRIAD